MDFTLRQVLKAMKLSNRQIFKLKFGYNRPRGGKGKQKQNQKTRGIQLLEPKIKPSLPRGSGEPCSSTTRTGSPVRAPSEDREDRTLEEQFRHIEAIDALVMDPLLKHWQVIPTQTRMPASYHPDRVVRRECLSYALNEARDFMETNNCGWTPHAFQKARDAALEFKTKIVPVLFPEWKDGAQTY